jgi:hypothetical protein
VYESNCQRRIETLHFGGGFGGGKQLYCIQDSKASPACPSESSGIKRTRQDDDKQRPKVRGAELFLILLISSSSLAPLYRVFIHIFPRQTMSLGNTLLQLFCRYCSWCLYLQFLHWLYCTFTLALSEVCVQCPIWLFSVVPYYYHYYYYYYLLLQLLSI